MPRENAVVTFNIAHVAHAERGRTLVKDISNNRPRFLSPVSPPVPDLKLLKKKLPRST